MSVGIKVFAPASIGNLACGFDVLGLALEKPGDEVIARFVDSPGLRISKISGAKGKLPYEVEKNTAGKAALSLLEYLGESERGIELEIHKKMPIGSGLGSSAASSVAGAMAINGLLKRPLEKRDLLPFIIEGEKVATAEVHADNIAPSLIGGITLVRSHDPLDVHRLPCPPGLHAVVIYPHVEILTKDARSVLKDEVTLSNMVKQSANLGAFVAALYKMDFELISSSLQDLVIEPQRAHLIPHFYDVKNAALEAGALGSSISGSGPSIFALCPNSFVADNVGSAMSKVYSDQKIGFDLFVSPVNHEGAFKY